MGRKSESGGVREHYGKVRVDFTYQGKRQRITLNKPWNERNRLAAVRMIAEVNQKIRLGIFDLCEYFPQLTLAPVKGKSFGDYATLWLASLTEHASSTREDYRKALNRIWLPAFEAQSIDTIHYSDIVRVLNDAAVRGKTRNNVLIPVRQVFTFAKNDRAIINDPTAAINNAKVQAQGPDPFELNEIEMIIADLAKHESEPVVNYFEAAFFAGFRPSEQIALTWTDIDFPRRTVRVARAVVRGRAKNTTKTSNARDVELTDRAWSAFEAQRKFTQLAGKNVFNNPAIDASWTDIQSQHRIWVRCLTRLKLRYRVPYQTRHTFASQALMAGANPSWVARQLGHSTTAMLFKVYGKWIDGADRSRERKKLDAAFSKNLVAETAAK